MLRYQNQKKFLKDFSVIQPSNFTFIRVFYIQLNDDDKKIIDLHPASTK